MYGYKARKGLLPRSRTGKVPRIASIGMCLGSMSFLLGIVMMSAAPIASFDGAPGVATRSGGIVLQSGVEDFYSEFRRMPVGDARVTTDSQGSSSLLGVPLGMEKHTPEARNPEGVRTLPIKEAVNRKNGLVYGETGIPEGMFDAYGNAYTVFLMREGDGSLRFQFAGKTIYLEDSRAAVVSPGKDGKWRLPTTSSRGNHSSGSVSRSSSSSRYCSSRNPSFACQRSQTVSPQLGAFSSSWKVRCCCSAQMRYSPQRIQ